MLRLRVIDRIREELGSAYSPGVVSQFSKVPVGEYAAPVRDRLCPRPGAHRRAHDRRDHRGAAVERARRAGELEKVTRTWLNEYDARTKTNEYWSDRLRTRALDPELDDEGPDYVDRVKALTAADVQAAARVYASGANRVRLVLASDDATAGR